MLAFALSCCNQKQSTNTVHPAIDSNNIYYKKDSSANKNSLTSDRPLFPGSDTLFAHLQIDGFKEHPVITIKVSSGTMLYANVITKQKDANIRFNQIQLPDSSFDGPFGKNISYPLKGPGNYKLIIGEDMMAEGKWSGGFLVKVWVK